MLTICRRLIKLNASPYLFAAIPTSPSTDTVISKGLAAVAAKFSLDPDRLLPRSARLGGGMAVKEYGILAVCDQMGHKAKDAELFLRAYNRTDYSAGKQHKFSIYAYDPDSAARQRSIGVSTIQSQRYPNAEPAATNKRKR